MKRTLTCILTITTLLTLLFTSCNADASAGLFKQLAEAKKPVDIRYRQIIGWNAAQDTLFFLTNDGIYSYDKTTNITTTVRENEKGHPVYEAYLDTFYGLIIYLINDGGNAEVHRYNLANKNDAKMTLGSSLSGPKVKHLLPNGEIVVQGKKAGTNAFAVITYNYDTGSSVSEVVFEDLDGYGLDSILFMSGNQQDSPDFMISFVDGDKNYKHYYQAQGNAVTLGSSLASFSIENSKLYLLTKDGKLYGSAVPSLSVVTATRMIDTEKSYQGNAFMYAVTDNVANKTYLITKSNTANEAMYVFSLTKGAIDTATGSEVNTGYAKQMSNVNIVSAFEKATGKLLIATEKNGMFDITITDAATGEGSSAGPEDYTL